MTLQEYQEKAARTINSFLTLEEQTNHGLFGLAAETGEVLGLYQKTFQGHSLDRDELIHELGDVMWMVAEICTANGIELDEVGRENIAKLLRRYPDGFDPERSLHREGDQ